MTRRHSIERRIVNHLRRRAERDGTVRGMSYPRIATALGVNYDHVMKAMVRLQHAAAVTIVVPGNRRRSAVWQLAPDAAALAVEAAAEKTAPDFAARHDIGRPVQVRVSCGLLARLLKFHGDHPPDADAAAAVARLRLQLGVS